jgi:hypothetical protein
MPLVFKCLALFMSITAAFAADKPAPFRPAPAGTMAHHQTNEQVTIGVEACVTADRTKAAFGKLDPNDYGVLPILVVIQNDTGKALQLNKMRVQYASGNKRADAIPASEVKFMRGPNRPKDLAGPAGAIGKALEKKNPLAAQEIETRAFIAQLIPPGQSGAGYFYFQGPLERGATILVSGLSEAATGRELFYFEIPLD